MINKLKLVILLVVASGIGILIILGSWLLLSYNQRMSLLYGTVEQSLFNAIQEVVQLNESTADTSGSAPRNSYGLERQLDKVLSAEFPSLPEAKKRTIIKQIVPIHPSAFNREAPPDRPFGPNPDLEPLRKSPHIRPLFLINNLSWNNALLSEVHEAFTKNIKQKGLRGDFDLQLISLAKPTRFENMIDRMEKKKEIRPLLVDPQNDLFIKVSFKQPWQFLLYALSWQLLVSIFILAVVVVTFAYLFLTIIRQNKVDMQRRNFVNSLTHELRTPITTVSLALEALNGFLGNANEEQRQAYHQMAREELDHLQNMIDRVLEIAEGDKTGISSLHCSRFNLTELVTKIVSFHRMQHAAKNIQLITNYSTADIEIIADVQHIKNILNNLIENAIKYGAQLITILVKTNELETSISVSDNGMGIPEAFQQQIFKPFFRVPTGDLYAVKGFGLGLPYVKQIVEQHGGKVTLKSKVNEGSTFILKFPKKREND